MLRKFFQHLLRKPVTWLANRVSSSPDRKAVFSSLTHLLETLKKGKSNAGLTVPYHLDQSRFIIFSDQHKGARDAADDFRLSEKNYVAALQHYYREGFTLVCLGDCEELWENKPNSVIPINESILKQEAEFLQDGRYYRSFGNHDLEWKYDFPRNLFLKPIFGKKLRVLEGLLLQAEVDEKKYSIFLTHGHQGDKKSDGNPFSTWVVASIWTPIQRYLEISVNTISDSFDLVDKHNIIMYEWSATQNNLIFISGHTHKPVFASLDHIERLSQALEKARRAHDQDQIASIEAELARRKQEYAGKLVTKTMAIPSYFNTGCCCFSDGDITGIELDKDAIRLIKWKLENDQPQRVVLEECPLSYLFAQVERKEEG